MESIFKMDSNEINNEDRFFTLLEGDSQRGKQRSTLQPFDCNDTWNDLHKQLNDSIDYADFFRFSQHIYENRIYNDVKYLDIMEYQDEVRSGFRYLQNRYMELQNSVTELQSEVHNSIRQVKKLKRHGFKQMPSVEKKLLSSLFNILSESIYLRENFHGHQYVYINNLVLLDEELDEVDEIGILKRMYIYLKLRYLELQKYSLIQESKIEQCKDLMDEQFGDIKERNEQKDVGRVIQTPESKDRLVHTPESKNRVIDSAGRVVHSPKVKGRVVHSPEAKGRVVHSPKTKGRVVHSPEAKGRVVHSHEAKGRVAHSPKAKGRVINSPEAKARVVHSPEAKGRVGHSPVSHHRRTPVQVEQNKVSSPEHASRYTPVSQTDSSSPFEEVGRVTQTPELNSIGVHTSKSKSRVVHSPIQKDRVNHSPISHHRRTPVQVEQNKVSTHVNHMESSSPPFEISERNVISPELASRDHEDYYENHIVKDQAYYGNQIAVQRSQRAVMPENAPPKRLSSSIPVYSLTTRVVIGPKDKIFNEIHSNIASAGYGNSKRRRSEFNNANVLPAVQSRAAKCLPIAQEAQQSIHDELEIKRASIKGIVKPSLLNKDVLRLHDPSVRVRGAPKQHIVPQKLNKTPVLPSIPRQQGSVQTAALPHHQVVTTLVLPRIPQPPVQPKQQQNVSRIQRLPTIQPPQPTQLEIKRTSIKGIVKPSLLNKDVLRLRDPSVRVRGAPKQQIVHQELNKTPVLPSIPRQRGFVQTAATPQHEVVTTLVLPRIPQPPAQPKQQQNLPRILRLPKIQPPHSQQQQQQILSRIPQPPKGERLRDAKYIQRRITRFQ